MAVHAVRSADEIRGEIEQRLGFFPPLFAPALERPEVLEKLWRQAVRGCVQNTLPPTFSERLFAVLSRYGDVPYSVVYHSCTLRPLTTGPAGVLDLLDGPQALPDADQAAAVLAAAPEHGPGFAAPGPVADAVLRAAVSIFLADDDRERLTHGLRRVLPGADLDQLMSFLDYVTTCLHWVQTHPGLSYEADLREITHLWPVLAEQPALGEFVAHYTRRHRPPHGLDEFLAARADEADRKFLLAFERAPIGMALTELDGNFLRVNQALCDLVGRDEATLTPMGCLSLTHPDDVEAYQANVARLIAGVMPSFQMDKRYRHGQGTYVWIRQSVALLRARDGTPRYLISQTEDVTALRERSEQLAAANAELQRSNRDLTQFATIAAHDLKGPLSVMVANASLLAEELPADTPAGTRDLVAHITAGGDRMAALVSDLLTYARVGTEQLVLHWTDVDALLGGLLDDLSQYLDTAGAQVHVAALGSVWAHPTHLRQVFTNLITNAVKYTPVGVTAVVEISAAHHNDSVTYTIADNGVGVPADTVDTIFTMFHRENTDTADGAGVGLAICHRVIERHGGAIWVEPRPNGGSLFHVQLPQRAPA